MITKIKEFLVRNVCMQCDYYNPENGTCESKKVKTCGLDPYVDWYDRHFCKLHKSEDV